MGEALAASPATPAITQDRAEAAGAAAREASAGKFVASFGAVGKEARMAVVYQQNQGEVWNQVAAANAASGAQSDSGAYTANYAQEQIVDRLQPYLEKLEQPITAHEQVVGVIVAINGRPASYDAFESTPLFKKLWPKLLKSAALDAANQAEEGKPQPCPPETAQQFVHDALNAPVERSRATGGLTVMTRSTDRIMNSAAGEQDVGGRTVHAAALSR